MPTFADYGIEITHQPDARGEVAEFCPECSRNRRKSGHRCLSVNVLKETWYCQHCGWSGGTGNGVSVPTAEYVRPKEITEVDLSIEAQSFFIHRKINLGVVRKHGITGNADAIKFPYRRDNELINVKTRYPNKKFQMETGAELILWGLDDCRGAEQIVVVEGEMDKLALETAGLPHVVSVPNGANIGKMEYLTGTEALFGHAHSIILAGDMDDPGQRLVDELASRIGIEKCYRVSWPDDCKDANDALMQHGPEAIISSISAAVPFKIAGISDVDDLWPSFKDLYKNGLPPGKSTGWANVDTIYTVADDELTTVTGIPNSGKSTWLDALMINMGTLHDWRFGIYSPESSPSRRHLARLAQKYLRKPFNPGPTERMNDRDLEHFRQWAQGRLNFIEPTKPDLEEILEKARQLQVRYGINALLMDPWNRMEHNRPKHLNETDYVAWALDKTTRFARDNKMHIWMVAHPKKMYRDTDGDVPVPGSYDISGSANWANMSDNILTVHRDEYTQIYTRKIRFMPEVGKAPAMVELDFNPVTGCYSQPPQVFRHFGEVAS